MQCRDSEGPDHHPYALTTWLHLHRKLGEARGVQGQDAELGDAWDAGGLQRTVSATEAA